jgi:hypothetical protein
MFRLFDTDQNKYIWPDYLSYLEVTNKYRKTFGIKSIRFLQNELSQCLKEPDGLKIPDERKHIYLFEIKT